MQFSYAAAILGLTKICRGGVDDTVPSTPVEPGTNEDEHLPLELNFGTSAMTKALVEDTVLPTGSSVGITIRDDYGRYTGDDYTNIRYSSALSAGVQVWETTSPVLLARETGTLFSYWPHSEDEVDGKTITIVATSDIQTDYMWGLPVAVSKSNRTASITMQHALSAVRIYCKRGSYTGAGEITGVAFGGDCAATAGTLDLTCGALDDLSGQGTMIAPAITAKTITSSYQKVSDIIVVPTSGTNGKVVVTLDGTDYPIEFSTLDLNPGEMSEFYLTANDGELSATDITVGDWTYGDPEGDEIVLSPKVKITGDIANIAFNNTISEDGTVTIKAMPTSGEKSFTEVEPVTFTGTATLTQSSDIDTGVRTITISDIESDVVITFDGTIEYDVIAVFNANAGESIRFQGSRVASGGNMEEIRIGDSVLQSTSTSIIAEISGDNVFKIIHENHVIGSNSYAWTSPCRLRLNKTLLSINGNAFYLSKITSINIPESIETVNGNAFDSCYYLNDVDIKSEKLTNLDAAFINCDALKSIKLPNSITKLAGTFKGCSNLESVILPSKLQEIGTTTFEFCVKLTSLKIPETCSSIGKQAFYGCTNLSCIIILAPVAPSLPDYDKNNNPFAVSVSGQSLPENGVLVVPNGTNYSSWIGGNYLGALDWTITYMNE